MGFLDLRLVQCLYSNHRSTKVEYPNSKGFCSRVACYKALGTWTLKTVLQIFINLPAPARNIEGLNRVPSYPGRHTRSTV